MRSLQAIDRMIADGTQSCSVLRCHYLFFFFFFILSYSGLIIIFTVEQIQDINPKTIFLLFFSDGLVGMAIVGGIGLGVAGLAGLVGLAVAKSAKS